MTWADIGDQVRTVRSAMQAAGRDPSRLEVGVRFPPFGEPFGQALADSMPHLLEAGVTQLYCPLRAPTTVSEAAAALERMARAFEQYRSLAPARS